MKITRTSFPWLQPAEREMNSLDLYLLLLAARRRSLSGLPSPGYTFPFSPEGIKTKEQKKTTLYTFRGGERSECRPSLNDSMVLWSGFGI
nr:hypothetical protein [Helianthus tuberosus]